MCSVEEYKIKEIESKLSNMSNAEKIVAYQQLCKLYEDLEESEKSEKSEKSDGVCKKKQIVRLEFIVTEAEFLEIEVTAGLNREEAIAEAIRLFEEGDIDGDPYAGDRICFELDTAYKSSWNVEEVEDE